MPVPSFVAGTALRRLPASGAPPRGFAYDFAPEPYPDGQWRLSPGHVLSVSLRAAPGRVAGPRAAGEHPGGAAETSPSASADSEIPGHAAGHFRLLRGLALEVSLAHRPFPRYDALSGPTEAPGGPCCLCCACRSCLRDQPGRRGGSPLTVPGVVCILCVCVLSSLPLATASPSDLQGIVSLHVVVDSRCDNDHGTAGTTCAYAL